MKEPPWRTALNWSAVITFFSIPLVAFILQVISEEQWATGLHFNEHLQEFKWLGDVYKGITALVFGLAGLNSWDKRLNGSGKPLAK